MPLETGTKVGRYEIRSPIASGGMGEVYLAFDTRLERNVAIKLLTNSENKEHLLRFKQEAKAVIALNHPHILTVYEFGQHEDLHFIVTEYLVGKTLRETIKEGTVSLTDALEIGIQIANALSSAHAAGIVHRDIKPENIMILPDGYVKVLDFGLAKMTGAYNQLGQNPEASTASLLHTRAGMIMGTVNYMSPEQLRGRDIDELTDIWSLGILLFETIGRARPFNGDSVGDVIAAVLEHPLPMLANFRPKVSEEIEKIISKALQKDKVKRYQTAQEFASDLKKAKIGIESGDFLLSADTLRQNDAHVAEIASHLSKVSDDMQFPKDRDATSTADGDLQTKLIKRNRIGAITIFVLISIIAGFGIYLLRSSENQDLVKRDWKFKRLTTNGNVTEAVISPDEKFIAYAREDGGQESLWLKQVSETGGTELIKPGSKNYRSLAFSPDGNSIYFVVFENAPIGVLYRMPILGGSPQKLTENVDSNVSLSPDGNFVAFIRSITKDGVNQIIVAKTDGTEQRMLTQRKTPDFYVLDAHEGLDWSPDGATIAVAAGRQDALGESMTVIGIDLETGNEKRITEQRWARVGKVVWAKDGKFLYITAVESDASLYQIVRVNKVTGKTVKITNESINYLNISLSKNNKTLLSVVNDDISNIFVAPYENPNQTIQIAKGDRDGTNGLKFTPNGKIVYVTSESENLDIWQMDIDGKNRVQISFDKASDEYPTISSDEKHIVFVSNRTGVPHIWQSNADGSQPVQLTNKGGESFPTITPDNKYVVYSARSSDRPLLWKVPIEGGESVQLTDEQTHWASISPDGKSIACLALLENQPITLAIVSMDSGKIIKNFDPVGNIASPEFPPVLRWTKDSRNVVYISTIQGVSNIISQPIDSSKPRKLTDFSTDRIFSFDLSFDEKYIVYSRGISRNSMGLFEEFTD
jgi:serine/threonine protein kinase